MRIIRQGMGAFFILVFLVLCMPISVWADEIQECEKHLFTQKLCDDMYLAAEENGVNAPTYYYSCEVCGKASNRRFKAERILFIGNSKTITHGAPAYCFERLAKYNNKGVIVTVCAVPSYTLTQLLDEPTSYSIIAGKAYDKVIIQENSAALWNPMYDSSILGSFKRINNIVTDINPNVKIYIRCPALGKEYKASKIKKRKKKLEFYALLNEEKDEPLKEDTTYYLGKKGFYSYSASRGIAMMRVRACNNLVKKANRGGLVLDSDIMYSYKDVFGKDNIWDRDKFHQNETGACLLAASFYRAIFGENPKMCRKSFSHKGVESILVDTKTYSTSYNDICEAMSKNGFKKFRNNTYKLLDEVYGSKG